MNILFFLTPKNETAFLYEDETLSQALEKMGNRKFSCIPVLSRDGKYSGTISEGDLLWTIMQSKDSLSGITGNLPIRSIPRRTVIKPVHIDYDIEDLMDRAINQNFVPVTDDQGSFIGIITRKAILKQMFQKLKELDPKE